VGAPVKTGPIVRYRPPSRRWWSGCRSRDRAGGHVASPVTWNWRARGWKGSRSGRSRRECRGFAWGRAGGSGGRYVTRAGGGVKISPRRQIVGRSAVAADDHHAAIRQRGGGLVSARRDQRPWPSAAGRRVDEQVGGGQRLAGAGRVAARGHDSASGRTVMENPARAYDMVPVSDHWPVVGRRPRLCERRSAGIDATATRTRRRSAMRRPGRADGSSSIRRRTSRSRFVDSTEERAEPGASEPSSRPRPGPGVAHGLAVNAYRPPGSAGPGSRFRRMRSRCRRGPW